MSSVRRGLPESLPNPKKGTTIMKLTTITNVSFDGVMQ